MCEMVLLGVVLILYFFGFYLIGVLVAEAFTKRRLVTVQAAAQKIPAGLNQLGERVISPTMSLRLRARLLEAGQPRHPDVDGFMSLKMIGAVAGIVLSGVIG